MSSLKLEPFAVLFWLLRIARAHTEVGEGGGGNISVDMYFFILLYNANFMDKLKFKERKKFIDRKFFFILQNHPTFHSEERLVNLVRGRECSGWSICINYGPDLNVGAPQMTAVNQNRNKGPEVTSPRY